MNTLIHAGYFRLSDQFNNIIVFQLFSIIRVMKRISMLLMASSGYLMTCVLYTFAGGALAMISRSSCISQGVTLQVI